MTYDRSLFKKLYDEGKTDKQIAESMGCCVSTVIKWRKVENLSFNVGTIQCALCGSPVKSNRPTVHCPRCRELIRKECTERYGLITTLRKKFCWACEGSPDAARDMVKEMEILEGREFVEMVFRGLIGREEEIQREMIEVRREKGIKNWLGVIRRRH